MPSRGPPARFTLLPANRCEIIDTWTVGGLRGTGSHDVALHDVFVPAVFGSGFFDPHVLPEARYRLAAMSRVISGLGAMALGIAHTAVETLKEIAGSKAPMRTTQMLRDTPDAQVRVSEAAALVRAAGCSCSTVSISFGQCCWLPARRPWRRGRLCVWRHRTLLPAR